MWSKVEFSKPTLMSLIVFASSSTPRRTSDWTKKETCGECYNGFNVSSHQYHCPPGRIISAIDISSC
jgi:hypothetical protein